MSLEQSEEQIRNNRTLQIADAYFRVKKQREDDEIIYLNNMSITDDPIKTTIEYMNKLNDAKTAMGFLHNLE